MQFISIILNMILAIAVLICWGKLKKSKTDHKIDQEWVNSIFDAIPFQISVTNNNLRWLFVNKATETALGKGRRELIGQQSGNWKADKGRSFFKKDGMKFQVDSEFIKNAAGDNTAHLEIIQEVPQFQEVLNKHKALLNQAEAIVSQISVSSQEIHSSSELITEQINKTSMRSIDANSLSEKAVAVIDKSYNYMNELTKTMDQISEKSSEIQGIIKIIEDIAFQTNILALNAAVEAARAGTVGRGFAVVADEVRNLASKSAQAAKDTTILVEDTVNAVSAGVNVAYNTANELSSAVGYSEEVARIINEFANATTEQKMAIEQIAFGISNLSKVATESITKLSLS